MPVDAKQLIERAKKKKTGKTTTCFYLSKEVVRRFESIVGPGLRSPVLEELLEEFVENASKQHLGETKRKGE